jgi:hypothetical protein
MRLILVVALLVSSLVACAAQRSVTVAWSEVSKSPDAFSGKRVALCGWFEAKMELCSLSQGASNLGTTGKIWIFPHGGWCSLDQAAVKPFEGWAIVDGVMHYGETYGHFGAWDMAMDRAVITIIDKPCGLPD